MVLPLRKYASIAILLLGLLHITGAQAAITFFGAAHSPADAGAQDASAERTITPPGSMVSGQLVIVSVTNRLSSGTMSNTTTGGQTWNVIGTADQVFGGTATNEIYCAIYNGTWSADPGWTKSGTNSSAFSLHMFVYSPSMSATLSCTPDVALAYNATASGTVHTITGQTPTASASVVTWAAWYGVQDSNTWGSLTGGWTSRGTDDDLENTTGGGLTLSFADKIQASASATGDVSNTYSTSTGAFTAIVTFKETAGGGGAPTFDSGPTVAAVDDNTFRVTYNADAIADTLECMAVPLDATAPTAAQIDSNTGSHGNATEASTGSADTMDFDVTDSPPFPAYDVHCELEDGTSNYSSVATNADVFLTAPAGYAYTARLTSIGVDSFCEAFNAVQSTDIATGDILKYPSTTSAGGYALTVGSDCQAVYDPDGDFSRQSALNWSIYDVSAVGFHASDIDAWFFDEDVACPQNITSYVIKTNLAMDTAPNPGVIDIDDYCAHPLGDAISTAVTSGTLPTGLTLSTNDIAGTATVEDEDGNTVTVTATSTTTGATGTIDATIFPITSWTLANYVGLSLESAEAAIGLLTLNTVDVDATFDCQPGIDILDIVTQNPGSGDEVEPFDTVDVVASELCDPVGIRIGSCLRKTVAFCEAMIDEDFGGSVVVISEEECPSSGGYGGGLIWAQTPAPRTLVGAFTTVTVNYCGSP